MLQYIANSEDSGFLNVDENVIECGDYARELAQKYFDRNPRESRYQVCIVDFDKQVSTIFEVTRDMALQVTAY